MAQDQTNAVFSQKLSAYILPATLALLAYLAQQNYSRITEQLNRIESRQSADLVQFSELKMRVQQLEQYIARNDNRATPAPQRPPFSAVFRGPDVYSQS